MQAVALTEGHDFEVVAVDDPTPGPGELLVRVRACGICGSDLKAYTFMPAGSVLGHEVCGEVVARGPDVAGDWPDGRLVASMPLRACGRCRWCLAGEPAHCERVDLLGLGGSPGAFAEYVRVDPATTVALPDSVGDLGALVEPLAVGLHVASVAEVRPGDRVLVIGGGSVGTAVSIWARRHGALEVVVSDPSPDRRDDAGGFGATAVHDPGEGPLPTGFDVVIECVGAPGLIQSAIGAVATRGRVVVAGVCTGPDTLVPVVAVMKEVDLRFAVYYRIGEFAGAAALLARGDVDMARFVGRRVGFDGVAEAFSQLTSTPDRPVSERKVLVAPGARSS